MLKIISLALVILFLKQFSFAGHKFSSDEYKIEKSEDKQLKVRKKYCTNDVRTQKRLVEELADGRKIWQEEIYYNNAHENEIRKIANKFDFNNLKNVRIGRFGVISDQVPLSFLFYYYCLQPNLNQPTNKKYELDRELKKIYNQIANINGLRSYKSEIGKNIYNQGYIVLPKDVEFIYSRAEFIRIAEDLERKIEEEKKITNKGDCKKILNITFCKSKNDNRTVEFDVLKKSPLRIIIGKTNTKVTPLINELGAAAYKHCKSYDKKTNIFSGTSNYTSGEGFYDQDITIETEKFTRFYCGEPKDIAKQFTIRDEGYNSIISQPLRIRGVTSNGNIGSGILISSLIKPKKEKPKSIADDDKIVPAGSGSGFFVSSNGTVITNHHVIEGCKINKVSHKGSQYEAKVLAVDKVNDIAILKTNITPDRVFPVSNEDVSLLEDVVVAGYPLGKQVSSAIKTHKGVVTALAGAGDNYSNFQTDASINQGNSGGPILDQKGNVVGIAVATWVEEGVQGVHFGIKSSTLKTFASANGLKFLPANNRDLSNKDLGKLIMQSTVYVECHMTIAKIKKMIAEAENKKAFFKEFE